MHSQSIICRSDDPEVEPFETVCYGEPHWPIAVAPALRFDWEARKWSTTDKWCIVHKPTGFRLRRKEWDTLDEAMTALQSCRPDFPAWPLATGDFVNDAATRACRTIFDGAIG